MLVLCYLTLYFEAPSLHGRSFLSNEGIAPHARSLGLGPGAREGSQIRPYPLSIYCALQRQKCFAFLK
jgi:hypothetical protein